MAALIEPAFAEDHSRVLAPEVNAFFKVSGHARVFLLCDITNNVTKGLTDGELGARPLLVGARGLPLGPQPWRP